MRRTERVQGLRRMKFKEICARARRGVLCQSEAAEILGVSEHTFRRWRDRYEAEGPRVRTIAGRGLHARRFGDLRVLGRHGRRFRLGGGRRHRVGAAGAGGPSSGIRASHSGRRRRNTVCRRREDRPMSRGQAWNEVSCAASAALTAARFPLRGWRDSGRSRTGGCASGRSARALRPAVRARSSRRRRS